MMSQGPRVMRPERDQLRWEMVDLESQLPPDHEARVVWSFVAGLELSEFYARIKARDDAAGRPASDPAVLLAVWLYAAVEGIGAARAIARLCEHHAAYRWLCGGVPVNHDMLSAFRRDSGAMLDRLLTQSLTGLIAEGLVTLEEVMIDGTKVEARASRSSLAKRDRLSRIETRVAAHVARLKQELEEDPSSGQRRQKERALRAAAEQEVRLARARKVLTEREAEKQERAKTHAKAEAEKQEPSVSTSDPEVRSMKMADGATRPAWNVQVATAQGFVVVIEPTDRRNDSGLAPETVAEIERRCGTTPTRLLADSRAMTQDDIVGFAETHPTLTIYAPLPAEREDVSAETLRKRRWQREREPDALRDWRARMASEAGKLAYRRRKLTEHAHARMKNRGLGRMLVHGITKVRSVCLLQGIAHNLLWANRLRAAAGIT
jgi:transposase